MSYCVNCGVELASTEKVCPLCDTEVINPRAPWTEPETPSAPDIMETIPTGSGMRVMAILLTIFLSIPLLVSLVCDLISTQSISWSVYVVSGIALFYVLFVMPMFFKKYRYMLLIPLNGLCVFLFLWIICATEGGNWIFTLGAPLCLSVTGISLLIALLFRSKFMKSILQKIGVFLFLTGILIVLIECSINLYLHHNIMLLHWSQYALIPCCALTIAFFFLDSQKKLKQEIIKRMFIK